MLEIDREFFLEIAADAVSQANMNLADKKEISRWVNAIARGVGLLETRKDFITWMPETKSLLIWSDSNQIYSANGICQCEAYKKGIKQRGKAFPCKHRALARLVRLYFELQERPNPDAILNAEIIEKAPYLKPGSGKAPIKIGNYRI